MPCRQDMATLHLPGLGADARSLAWRGRARAGRVVAGAGAAAEVREFAADSRGDGGGGALGGVGVGVSRPGVAEGGGVSGYRAICGDESGAGGVGGAGAGVSVLGCGLGAAEGFGPDGGLRGRDLRRSYRRAPAIPP